MSLRRQPLNRLEGWRIDPVCKTRSESYRAQHPQLVFAEPMLGFADGADDAGFQIFSPADKIEHFIADGIKQ